MRKSSPRGNLLLVIGILLISGAVLMMLSEWTAAHLHAIDNRETLAFLEQILPERTPGIREDRSNPEMPAAAFGNLDYSAVLAVPRLSVTLPVCNTWSRLNVRRVPCRFGGNPYDGTLIIGGADSAGQFDFLSRLDIGDGITVTDMTGREFSYTVKTVLHAKNARSETLIDVQYDLSLFARMEKSGEVLIARCSLR